jgi:expansin (peptidoglycan-binding protein)
MVYGDVHAGAYNLGPVDWQESQWHNSCAPYPAAVQMEEGQMLAGVGLDFNGNGQLCDACILINADNGNSVVARVVTTGQTVGPNDVDLSPAAYNALNKGEYPRNMKWQIVQCPNTGPIQYQYQTGANVYWTSLWVRNIGLPLQKVEVKSANHPNFTALALGSDGTYTDASGFGMGSFTLRVTAIDNQVVTDTFPDFTPGALVNSSGQF